MNTRFVGFRPWSSALSLARPALILGGLVLAVASALAQTPEGPRSRRIAIFGSSVASGTGDETGREGYAGKLRELLAPRGWEVLNQSRGGDSTLTAAPRFAPEGEPRPDTKYLLPVDPAYVVIGLSLGNEGIKNQTTSEGRDLISRQFETGIRGFIARSREHRIVPVVANCYARSDFTEAEYAATRRMNLLINSWDVPSINFLGAVDDGAGRWVRGFVRDALHPNAAGHQEMALAIVPSLFEALENGKPRPVKTSTTSHARVSGGTAALSFAPADPMHSFAVALAVRAQGDGPVFSVSGATLDASYYYLFAANAAGARGGANPPVTMSAGQLAAINGLESRLPAGGQAVTEARSALVRTAFNPAAGADAIRRAVEDLGSAEHLLALARAAAFAEVQAAAEKLSPAQRQTVVAAAGRGGSLQTFGRGGGQGAIEETRLTPAASFTATVGIRDGVWTYTSANGTVVPSPIRADGGWHHLAVSHFTARGETLFFVDGRLAGRTAERLEPRTFAIGGSPVAAGTIPQPIDLRDVMIYRSALNEDEVAAIQAGTLIQSSLEIYAPLADANFALGSPVENRAQSMTYLTAGTGIAPRAQ